MDKKRYLEKTQKAAGKSPLFKNCVTAFAVGGGICVLGEALFALFARYIADPKECAAWVSVSLIALTAVFTGVGVFDKLAKHAGAGTMVPITGFANSVAAPAVEYQTEGRVTGTAVKMFSIAGPVIVYGCSAASFYGLIYYFFLRG